MGQRYTVEKKCTPTDLRAFDRFIDAYRPTVNRAHAWLKERGYSIARSCTYGYLLGEREKREAGDEVVRAAFRRLLRGQEARQRLIVTRLGRVEAKTDELIQLLKTLVNIGETRG